LLKSEPCVSENKWKMTFELQADVEKEENEPIEGDVEAVEADKEEKEGKSFKCEVRINGPNGA